MMFNTDKNNNVSFEGFDSSFYQTCCNTSDLSAVILYILLLIYRQNKKIWNKTV